MENTHCGSQHRGHHSSKEHDSLCGKSQETRSQVSNGPSLAVHTAIRHVWEGGGIISKGDSGRCNTANTCFDADTERQGSGLCYLQAGLSGTDVRRPQRFVYSGMNHYKTAVLT